MPGDYVPYYILLTGWGDEKITLEYVTIPKHFQKVYDVNQFMISKFRGDGPDERKIVTVLHPTCPQYQKFSYTYNYTISRVYSEISHKIGSMVTDLVIFYTAKKYFFANSTTWTHTSLTLINRLVYICYYSANNIFLHRLDWLHRSTLIFTRTELMYGNQNKWKSVQPV